MGCRHEGFSRYRKQSKRTHGSGSGRTFGTGFGCCHYPRRAAIHNTCPTRHRVYALAKGVQMGLSPSKRPANTNLNEHILAVWVAIQHGSLRGTTPTFGSKQPVARRHCHARMQTQIQQRLWCRPDLGRRLGRLPAHKRRQMVGESHYRGQPRAAYGIIQQSIEVHFAVDVLPRAGLSTVVRPARSL